MNKITQKKLIDAVKKVPQIAARENWVLTLDKDEGSLFYSPKLIPDKAELFQITDEYSIYLDSDLNPKGIMVEYFDYNFVKHHPEFKEIAIDIFGDAKNEEVKTISVTDKETRLFKALFEKTLISETLTGTTHKN